MMDLKQTLLLAAKVVRILGNQYHMKCCQQAAFIESVVKNGDTAAHARLYEALVKEMPEFVAEPEAKA